MECVMIIILGLIIVVAAVVVGVAGVLGNGSTHGLAHSFSVLGFHVTGSGTVFLYGIAVGAIALFGLLLLLTGARRTSRRGSAARRGLRQSRRETAASRQETAAVSKARDDLIDQRDTARAYTASALASPAPGASPDLSPDNGRPPIPAQGRPSRPRLFGRRPAAAPKAADPGPPTAQAAPDIPVGAPAPDVPAGAPAPDVPAGAPAPAG
jgi:UPF0716 family protein affecting phage T7 exclusion